MAVGRYLLLPPPPGGGDERDLRTRKRRRLLLLALRGEEPGLGGLVVQGKRQDTLAGLARPW